ncbi:hypothetical protein RLL94_05240 [Streptococcus pneumoniae]|uniref:hypothetical protein n=1 Tax=Streptococcus pneumoniae TaxID=1313 RepID=UPI00287A7AD8|nr:hypothetical protein [Streptococcus pneumoniae]MDS2998018.1 hypothetical protein [Streptococcus pneumoniae]MDS4570831.1 hypothetical protein [Streptococcus pneumoniae]MDS6035048.1 hypothetical protein [Streptococcus pneumoniae]MDS8511801.1 hypothetical protein [Streptococcus pneumoniae]MDS8534169.1 hypothetical protein [Streptococcus pneumoniae]
MFSGCNIENAAFSPTCCAERVSFYKAVFKGERSFSRTCIVGGKNGILSSFIAPCGVCCQVMIEFVILIHLKLYWLVMLILIKYINLKNYYQLVLIKKIYNRRELWN